MIGRTNAVAGGDLKLVTGSFRSSTSSQQTSFTVTGLQFEPKIIIVYLGNWSRSSEYIGTGSIDMTQIFDLMNGVAYANSLRTDLQHTNCLSSIAVSKAAYSNGTLTITAYSAYSHYNYGDNIYGTYNYRIYG